MKRKIYLMRHGATEMNEQDLYQGWWDSPLTKEGIEQAKQAGKALEKLGVKFDQAFSSTSGRAMDTLELATEGKLPYKREAGLRERHFGAFEGKSWKDHQIEGRRFDKIGGESLKQARERVVKAVDQIMEENKGENTLIVSHGAIMRQLMLNSLKPEDLGAYLKRIPNCTIFVLDYDDESKKVELADIISPERQKEILEEGTLFNA